MEKDTLAFDSDYDFYVWVHQKKYIEGMSWEEVGDILNTTKNSVRCRYNRLEKQYGKLARDPENFEAFLTDYYASLDINTDGTVTSKRIIEIEAQDCKSPEILLKLHGFDPESWVLLRARNNYWQMMKSHKIGGGAVTLYQSKIDVAPLKATEITFQDVDEFFSTYAGPKSMPIKAKSSGDRLLEVVITDLHIAARPKAGIPELKERFAYTIHDILKRIENNQFEEILIALPGDIFHFDTKDGKTTSGTQMETYLTYKEAFDLASELFIWAITEFAKKAPVKIICIPGNHDRMNSYFLIKSLEYYFKDEKNVSVSDSHENRQYKKFGKVLIGWCHGDIPKTRIGKWLHIDAREEWGSTKYAEIHVGHIHHQVTLEDNGVILRYLPTMAQADEWHDIQGYIGHQNATCCFVWDKELGLTEQWYTYI